MEIAREQWERSREGGVCVCLCIGVEGGVEGKGWEREKEERSGGGAYAIPDKQPVIRSIPMGPHSGWGD